MLTLFNLGIVKNKKAKTAKLFHELIPDFTSINYDAPSQYINIVWSMYLEYRRSIDEPFQHEEIEEEKSLKANKWNSINGNFFEYAIITLLIKEQILPVYLRANVAFVPNVNYDILFYSEEFGPICLSAKTSLRERYKQADLEAIALKYVHRRSKSYLITLFKEEANSVNLKIKNGDVIGIDHVFLANETEFDSLITKLKSVETKEAPKVKVISSNSIVTEDLVTAKLNNGTIGKQR